MRRCMLRRMNRASVEWRVPHAQPAFASTASDIISDVSFTVSTVSILVLLRVLTPSALGCNTFQILAVFPTQQLVEGIHLSAEVLGDFRNVARLIHSWGDHGIKLQQAPGKLDLMLPMKSAL